MPLSRTLTSSTSFCSPLGLTASALAVWLSLSASVTAQPTTEDDAEAKAIIASAYTTSKSDPLTIEHCGQIIALCKQAQQKTQDPKLTTYVKQLTSWAHNKRGERYLQLAGENEGSQDLEAAKAYDTQAQKDFAAAIATDPQQWKAYHNRGVCRAIAGDATQAIADFSQTIKLNPSYINAWFNRAELYLDVAKYAPAITDYTEVLKLNAKDVSALIGRGDAHLMLRQHQAAITDYTAAIKLAPENAMPLIQRGTALRETGQWKSAREDYNKALKMDMSSYRAYQHTAWLLATCPEAQIRDAELAVLAAEKAEALADAPDWAINDTLAAAYANAGRFKEAEAKMDQAIAQAPKEEVEPLKQRLAQYKAGKPFRDSFLPQ